MGSLGVKHPGIGKIGWYTIPCIILLIVAVVRTYRELPEEEKSESPVKASAKEGWSNNIGKS